MNANGAKLTGLHRRTGKSRYIAKPAPTAESYNRYYGNGQYDTRYPRPNPPTYQCVLRLARSSSRILDFGAGSGRYALPLIRSTNAFVCAYDISVPACEALERHATAAGVARQRLLVTPDLDAARAAGPYDLVISIIGVLSHIEGADNRIKALTSIHSMLTRDGLLFLTVPNALRRFPMHASTDGHNSSSAFPVQTHNRRRFPSARPVTYRHHLDNEERLFHYYLFSRRELTTELSTAGFTLKILESDSILPERILVRSPQFTPADDLLCRLLPSWAGYGLRAICFRNGLT
jgi:2-polyprenyl-3-methyl-5-hydroxy-6-metoxy-1,4-benzoquinol methylase